MVGVAGLSFAFAGCRNAEDTASIGTGSLGKELSPWVTIGTDGTVTIMSPAIEMGQGSRTSLPLMLAEELDADWDRVQIMRAPPIESIYGNPGFGGIMYTAGSTAVESYYMPLRLFGAQVRQTLLQNAARHWNVPIDELSTEPNTVVHASTNRRIDYGAISAFAEVPDTAPEISETDLKDPGEFRLIGKDVMRVELPQKVDGSAQYSIDVQLPGMIYGAVLRTAVYGETPDSVDDSKTLEVGGVLAVEVLPYGVGVIAETPWAAFAGKKALSVTWSNKSVGNTFNSKEGIDAFAEEARTRSGLTKAWQETGDVETALNGAARIYEREYRSDYAYHAQMEPLNAVASVSPNGESCEIWCGTQAQAVAVAATAEALDIAPTQVKLNDMLLGGGFGRRGARDQDFVIDAVLLSDRVKRPVKVMWTREDDLRNGRFHPMSASFVRAGVDADGQVIAWHHRKASELATKSQDPVRYEAAGQTDFISMAGTEINKYAIANKLSEQVAQHSGMRTIALRGIGFVHNKFVTEVLLDEIALDAGIDPVDYRLNLLRGHARATKIVETVAEMSNWGSTPEGHGLGVSYIDYKSQVAAVVDVTVNSQSGAIKVHNAWIAIDCGLAVQPDNVVAQQMGCTVYGLGLALSESISMDQGIVEQTNFHNYRIPRMSEVPNIEIEIVHTPNPPSGAGQMATPLIAPAISNAVAAATGVRLRHMPMTPERVLKALNA
jgi:isoquinoline 1-oxidoreductase beta subunit